MSDEFTSVNSLCILRSGRLVCLCKCDRRCRGEIKALIGGECIFIYSGSVRLISFEVSLISKEISRAEPAYVNIRLPVNVPPAPIPNMSDIFIPENTI